jgi:hypothetical protein
MQEVTDELIERISPTPRLRTSGQVIFQADEVEPTFWIALKGVGVGDYIEYPAISRELCLDDRTDIILTIDAIEICGCPTFVISNFPDPSSSHSGSYGACVINIFMIPEIHHQLGRSESSYRSPRSYIF